MRSRGFDAMVATLAGAATAAAAAPNIAAGPMASRGTIPTYPRLTAFPAAAVMAEVNAALAVKQKEDRQSRVECMADVKAQGQKPDRDTYSEQTRVAYLSPRLFSISVLTSYFCATAYPTNGAQTPVTFDLSTGKALDWAKVFKPGFLPAADDDKHAPTPGLLKLYRAGYPKGADPDCRGAVEDADPFGEPPTFYLDAERGVVVLPDFPHVSAACAEEVALTPKQLAPYLADPTILADLKATVKRKP